MTVTVNDAIQKFSLELRPGGNLGILGRKPTARELEELRAMKPQIVAELQRRAAERWAREDAERQARAEEKRAILAGERSITLQYHDGEYLSGWEVVGSVAADLLEEIGLAKFVRDWGYLVPDAAVKALGTEFTYAQALEYTRAAREAEAARKAEAEAARRAKFDEAKASGRPVLLAEWTEPCSERGIECSLDVVKVYAMPDGSVKTERTHTY